jgi:hypothetical protein
MSTRDQPQNKDGGKNELIFIYSYLADIFHFLINESLGIYSICEFDKRLLSNLSPKLEECYNTIKNILEEHSSEKDPRFKFLLEMMAVLQKGLNKLYENSQKSQSRVMGLDNALRELFNDFTSRPQNQNLSQFVEENLNKHPLLKKVTHKLKDSGIEFATYYNTNQNSKVKISGRLNMHLLTLFNNSLYSLESVKKQNKKIVLRTYDRVWPHSYKKYSCLSIRDNGAGIDPG